MLRKETYVHHSIIDLRYAAFRITMEENKMAFNLYQQRKSFQVDKNISCISIQAYCSCCVFQRQVMSLHLCDRPRVARVKPLHYFPYQLFIRKSISRYTSVRTVNKLWLGQIFLTTPLRSDKYCGPSRLLSKVHRILFPRSYNAWDVKWPSVPSLRMRGDTAFIYSRTRLNE